MSDVIIEGGLTQENAILLLAAAEELGEDPGVVRTTLHGFVVPKKVAKAAGLNGYDPHADFNDEIDAAVKAAEADSEPHDFAAPTPAAPPLISDDGELVETEQVETEAVPVVTAQEADEAAASTITEDGVVEKVEDTEPAKNASRDAWVEFAKGKGATDEDLADLKRNDIAAKYGTKE